MVTTEARTATDVVRAYFDALQQGSVRLARCPIRRRRAVASAGAGHALGCVHGQGRCIRALRKVHAAERGHVRDRSGGNDHGERGLRRGNAPFSRASRH
jgi:hypothetical protein